MDPLCSVSELISIQPFTTQQWHHQDIVQPDDTSSDLLTTLSFIQNLTILAESSLKASYEFLFCTPPSSSSSLGHCPFDSRHVMPPEFLFRHSINCSSAPGPTPLNLWLLDNLRYTKSLKSEDELLNDNLFVRPLSETESDICFSLEDELTEIFSNFFYKDCPGIVTTPEPDTTSRTFTLPAILTAECANFTMDRGEGAEILERRVGILPSDFCSMRTEVEAWHDFPTTYSFSTILVAAGLCKAVAFSLKRWIILNSPKFGILIDTAMRDHVYLLLKLCLKAVIREAVFSSNLVLEQQELLDPRVVRFECPRLASSLSWLAFQMSILYGEVSGKFFVMGMLKESFLLAGKCLMVFRTEDENAIRDEKLIATYSGSSRELDQSNPVNNLEASVHKSSETSSCAKVFVSQVASAIAALHERFFLEQRIKDLRCTQAKSRFQLMNEYLSTSVRATQERAKRPNYRPLLEHEGLIWQRQNKEDFGMSKTREELLAEERDYKRRRMSYRGKKLKRNSIQVLHDIIDDHMEEIRLAGGIGCNVKIASETAISPKFEGNENKDVKFDPCEARRKKPPHYAGSLTHHETRYELSEDQHMLEKNEKTMPSYRSQGPSYHSGFSRSIEKQSRQVDRTNQRPFEDRYEGKSSRYPSSSKVYDSGSTFSSKSQETMRYDERNYPSESRKRHASRASDNQRKCSRPEKFEDRYEPFLPYNDSDTF